MAAWAQRHGWREDLGGLFSPGEDLTLRLRPLNRARGDVDPDGTDYALLIHDGETLLLEVAGEVDEADDRIWRVFTPPDDAWEALAPEAGQPRDLTASLLKTRDGRSRLLLGPARLEIRPPTLA